MKRHIYEEIVFFNLLLAYVFFSFSGCSYRAWYEGFREAERQNCYKIEGAAEKQECLDRVAETSYDQYQKERKGSQD